MAAATVGKGKEEEEGGKERKGMWEGREVRGRECGEGEGRECGKERREGERRECGKERREGEGSVRREKAGGRRKGGSGEWVGVLLVNHNQVKDKTYPALFPPVIILSDLGEP